MSARRSTRAAPASFASELARRRAARAALVLSGAVASCTDGTTPDCSDAQCFVAQVSGAMGDAAREAGADSGLDSDGSGADSSSTADAVASAEDSAESASLSPDAFGSPDGSRDAADALPPSDGGTQDASD